MSEKYPCGNGCKFVAKSASGLLAHQRGSKCSRLPEAVAPDYLGVAAKVASDGITTELILNTADQVEQVKRYKIFFSRYQAIKKEFPWRSKDELMRDLVTVPGPFKDLYDEAFALGAALFKERSAVDDALNKPHSEMDWVLHYEDLMGSKNEPGGLLRERVDAAWVAAKDMLKAKIGELFAGEDELREAVLKNIKLYEQVEQ